MIRCMQCMEEYDEQLGCCPHCRRQPDAPEPFQLPYGTMFDDRFLIGAMLGHGGFGITYIGWDSLLDQKVAIKEYLPMNLATRINGRKTVTVYSEERRSLFEKGRESFAREARRLAMFNKEEGVITVYHSFEENGTAYFVMEYVEGETVEERVRRKGRLSCDEVRKIMVPLLDALEKVHEKGIIHRDIAPDNIYVTRDGKVKLLDFGAARSTVSDAMTSQSISMIIKRGYAPEEQYRGNMQLTPASDVYSVAATIYYMLSGTPPKDAMERTDSERLVPPSELADGIDHNMDTAVLNALILDPHQRTQSAIALREEIMSRKRVKKRRPHERADAFRLSSRTRVALSISTTAVFLLALVLIFTLLNAGKLSGWSQNVLAAEQTYVPGVLSLSEAEAQQRMSEAGLELIITDKEDDEDMEAGLVLHQSLQPGAITEKGSVVTAVTSRGPKRLLVRDVRFMRQDTAQRLLAADGLDVHVEYVESADHAPGTIIDQDLEPGTVTFAHETITLRVSAGTEQSGSLEELPQLQGLPLQDALARVREAGGWLIVEEYVSDAESAGTVLQAQLADGHVTLRVSSGSPCTVVPDVELMTQEDAEEALDQAGLVSEIREAPSAYVEEGKVLTQDQEAGTITAPGTQIIVTVCRNDEQVLAVEEEDVQEELETPQEPGEWTAWTSDDFLLGDERYEVMEKTQYASYDIRHARSETAVVPEGYALIDTQASDEYGAWSEWSDYVEGEAGTDSETIEYTATEYQYRYFNWLCPEATRTPDCYCYPFAGYRCRTCGNDCDVYEERLVWNSPPESHVPYYLTLANGLGSWAVHWNGVTNDDWFYNEESLIAATRHRERTRSPLYDFTYRAQEPSAWQDERIVADEDHEVITRTVYRYRLKAE